MEKNFKLVLDMIKALNGLHDGIGEGPLFEVQVISGEFRIYGLPCYLAQLFSLLWSNACSYIFRLEHDGEDPYISVINTH